MIYRDIADWVGPTANRTPHGMGNAVGVVLHIQEGNEAGTEAWQRNPASQVSSHFLAPKVGRLRQMVDTADKAWCEVAGNAHWWSVEIEGRSGDSLTPDQLESCAQVLARAHRDEAVPLAVCNNPLASNDAQGGLGYHAMGGNAWGGHFDCPGTPIINARPAVVSRASAILAPHTIGDGDVKTLVRKTGTAPVYLSDGITRRWVRSPQELADVRYLATVGAITLWNGGKAGDGDIFVADDTDAFGVLIGPDPTAPSTPAGPAQPS